MPEYMKEIFWLMGVSFDHQPLEIEVSVLFSLSNGQSFIQPDSLGTSPKDLSKKREHIMRRDGKSVSTELLCSRFEFGPFPLYQR